METLHFPGALSLTEELDQLVLAILRDGKHIVGRLSSLDQYTNVVLEDASEWVIYGNLLAIQPIGLYIVRSDNIVMISSFDESKLSKVNLVRVSTEELVSARSKDQVNGVRIRSKAQNLLWNFDSPRKRTT